MKQVELEKKYGKRLLRKILRGGYQDGCTIGINEDGIDNIYESDIINAIKEINGKPYDWD